MILSVDFSSYGKGLRLMLFDLKQDHAYKRQEQRIAQAVTRSWSHKYQERKRTAQVFKLF
jgi:hypothetical protein